MDRIVVTLTEEHLDQLIEHIINYGMGGVFILLLVLIFRTKSFQAWGLKWLSRGSNGGNGKESAKEGYKPPCGGKNAPEVATKGQLDDLRDDFTAALKEHDGKNDKDFARLHSDIEKLEGKIDTMNQNLTNFLIAQAGTKND